MKSICFQGAERQTDCRRDHAKLLGNLIDRSIKSLDSSAEEISSLCLEYGQNHINLKPNGLDAKMWDDLGDTLLEYVRRNDTVRKHRELARAWAALISFLMDKIKQGHGLRRRSFLDMDHGKTMESQDSTQNTSMDTGNEGAG